MLPEELRWRHVRYEPTGDQAIDFTWEREWRMPCDELRFSPADAVVIVPNEEWASALRKNHDDEQDMVVELYATAIERQTAELRREPFLWHIAPLQRLPEAGLLPRFKPGPKPSTSCVFATLGCVNK